MKYETSSSYKLSSMAAKNNNITLIKTLKTSLTIPFQNLHLMGTLLSLILTLELSMSLINIRNAGILTVEMIITIILLPSQTQANTATVPLHGFKDQTLAALLTLNLAWYCIISISCMVYSSASIYNTKHITCMDLFQRMRKTWMRPAITGFYISLLSVGVIVFFAILANFANLDGILLVVFLALCLYVYLAMAWMVAIVISVVEDDCYGLEALAKASRLVRGRRLQGFGLMGIVTLVQFSLMLVILVYLGGQDHQFSFLRGFVLLLVCLVKVFAYIVYVVFYCECVKNEGVNDGDHGMGGEDVKVVV